ncbi:hypothetical protein SAMN05428949_5457 [Chitinophaga sp. YR627]|nr:hypothetical protein SAMN05428949_5457 [Chitinophaga sp. YR627]
MDRSFRDVQNMYKGVYYKGRLMNDGFYILDRTDYFLRLLFLKLLININ